MGCTMANVLFEYIAKEAMDNITALLYGEYDEVVYFYFPDEPEQDVRDEALGRFVTEKLNTALRYFEIPERTADAVMWSFKTVMEEHPEEDRFVIETTGGAELFLVAGGMLLAEAGARVSFCNYSGVRNEERKMVQELTVDDVISLQGCKIVAVCDGRKIDYLNGDFRNEVMKLWNAVKTVSADWNRFAMLTTDEHPDSPFTHGKTFSGEQDRVISKRIMEKLAKTQIICDYQLDKVSINRFRLQYSFGKLAKTPALYEKSGTVLEMFTCMAAAESGLFRDCMSGVSLDADGIICGTAEETRNEIDVLMLRGNRPVFVSCKNTRPTKEYLYEIMAMAQHYGGAYAIPALVASADTFPAVAERAEEMGVILIDRVAEKTLRELKDELRKAFEDK